MEIQQMEMEQRFLSGFGYTVEKQNKNNYQEKS